jgi:uncharacterized protein (TIGR02145 family)
MGDHVCGIKEDGNLLCWGNNIYGQADPPSETFSQVSAGGGITCGVKIDGTLDCWGDNNYGQTETPSGTYTQVTSGYLLHACALKIEGTVDCWGWDVYPLIYPPPDKFIQIDAGGSHTCGVKTDGTVACWWINNVYGQADPPSGTFVQVSAGYFHTCGVRTDGSVACWGAGTINTGEDFQYGQSLPPSGKFTQVSAGYYHTCGIKTDGSVACWGLDNFGSTEPPEDLRLTTGGNILPNEQSPVQTWLLLLLDDEEGVSLTCDSNDILLYDNNSDCVEVGCYWWSDNVCRGVSESETVESANGRIWMDRNLGAFSVAQSVDDSEAYGDLYQWGRDSDGHQLRISETTSTLSSTDNPSHTYFILAPESPRDWRTPQNDNLWQGVAGTNNPCPAGFRLPTVTEWETERLSWSSNNSAGAFGSPLKLVVAGKRDYGDGAFNYVDSVGHYWSSTLYSDTYNKRQDSRNLLFDSNGALATYGTRANGYSVRCIKD